MLKKAVLSSLLSLIISLFVGVVFYWIIVTLFPPYVIDANGNKHLTMPIGAVFLSGLASIVSGITTFALYWTRHSRRSNRKIKIHESTEN